MSELHGVMLQFFHWHSSNDGTLWTELADASPELAKKGFTSIWIPPAYKGLAGGQDVGYGVYDLFDLGEFNQKGGVRTKYGTKQQLVSGIKAAQAAGLQVYADVVLNHRCGADGKEEVELRAVKDEDRNQVISEAFKATVWSSFDFPGRGDTYSAFKWRAQHFKAFDHKEESDQSGEIYRMADKDFSGEVSFEKGNFDYLMGADVDHYHQDVRKELFTWGKWFIDQTGVDGLRLDAVKHYPASFAKDWISHLRAHFSGREIFCVSEYWSSDVADLHKYIEATDGVTGVFDVPLHRHLHNASKSGKDFDMSKIFDGTLVKENPLLAITFVDNHDTQPGQSLESWVEDWFKPMAYALILLRREGYPCVFYADYFGAECPEVTLKNYGGFIDTLLEARHSHGHGDQHDYFDHPNCIAWTRTGDPEHPGAMVVVMSNGDAGFKRVAAFKPNARFQDATGNIKDDIVCDADGFADFPCPPGTLSVWLER